MTDTAQPRPATTRDLGLAIRDFVEGVAFHHFEDDCQLSNTSDVVAIDCSDPSNLLIHICDSATGSLTQTFHVRIFAGGA